MNKVDQLRSILNGSNLWLFEDLVNHHSSCEACGLPIQLVQEDSKVQVRCAGGDASHYNNDCIRDNVLRTMLSFKRNAGGKGVKASQARKINARKRVEFVDTQGISVHLIP